MIHQKGVVVVEQKQVHKYSIVGVFWRVSISILLKGNGLMCEYVSWPQMSHPRL